MARGGSRPGAGRKGKGAASPKPKKAARSPWAKGAKAEKPHTRIKTLKTPQRALNAFLAALSEGYSIRAASERAGFDRSVAYAIRGRNEKFRLAWDCALEDGTDVIEDEALRRAVAGVLEPVVAQGRLAKNEDGSILTVRKFSDSILLALLKARRDKFREKTETKVVGADGGPVQITRIERIIVYPPNQDGGDIREVAAPEAL